MSSIDQVSEERASVRSDLSAIFVSLELSLTTWLVTSLSPGSGEKMSKHQVRGGDVAGLFARFSQLQAKYEARTGRPYRLIVIHEAGLDGFWIHRTLENANIESHVVDPASIATSRRRRRVKTDGVDGEALVRALLAPKRGEPRVCAMAKAPTAEQEDRRQISRERRSLTAERVKNVNRMKGLLFAQGITEYEPVRRDRRQKLEALRTGDGRPLPVCLKQRLSRELDRLELLLEQVRTVETQRDALLASQAEDPQSPAEVASLLVGKLEGLPIWGYPRTQVNVVPPPSIPSIIGSLLPAIYNPNLISDDTSYGLALAEASVAAMVARLVGYDAQQSAGVFTFGGTGTTLYGVKLGIEKAFPDAMDNGVRGDGVILASAQSHYSRLNVAGWLGLGEKNVVEVPTHLQNDIRIDRLDAAARAAISQGQNIVALVATMGTTDAFGVDDLDAVVDLRDRLVDDYALDYTPHVHADAVIGWAWSVFNDYDFERNPLGFRPRTVRALAAACRRISKLHRADSIGIDFHKTGFAPYISSLFLVRDRADLQRLARGRAEMPYLFQSGERHPGVFTLETSRSGSGVLSAYANLHLFGRVGLRVLLGHLVEMAESLREHLEGHDSTTVLNDEGVGMVTVFRVYPDGVDTWTIKERERTDPDAREVLLRHNDYNRRLFRYLYDRAMRGEGVHISMTDCYRETDYGEPIVGLKSFILSPFIDEKSVQSLVNDVLAARQAIKS